MRHPLPTFLRPGVLAGTLLLAGLASAQVSTYTFSQSTEPYVEISATDGGYELGTPSTDDRRVYVDPNNLAGTFSDSYLNYGTGPGFPIGFNFQFNGEVFDRIGISSMGWISFGKSTDGDTAVKLYTSDHWAGVPLFHSYNAPAVPFKRNKVCGFAVGGLRAQNNAIPDNLVSSFHMATIGTAPNRVCVIQWSKFQTSYDNHNNEINFQIRLNETSNAVDTRYGHMHWGWLGAGKPQVGLGGQNNMDFNSRMTVYEEPTFAYDWNNTVPSLLNTDGCTAYDPTAQPSAGPSIYPVNGLNFRWTPATCPPPAWPAVLSNITYNSATFSWTNTGATSYDYIVSATNDPNAPSPVANVTGWTSTSASVSGLEKLTWYYLFVRANCGGTPGVWSSGTPFRTQGGGVIVCGGEPTQENYCYGMNEMTTWHYTSADGTSPIRIVFNTAFIGDVDRMTIWDGNAANVGTVLYDEVGPGNGLAGLQFTSTGPDIFVKFTSDDIGYCGLQDWYTPWQWVVGCMNCTPALAAYQVVNVDCDAQQYSVQALLVSMGSATTLSITNTGGVPPTVVTATGVYTVGPFTAGAPVTVTVENPDNPLCDVSSTPLVNPPCPVIDCGPTDYTHCYANGEHSQWLYQSPNTELMGIRFRSGSVSYGDAMNFFDGNDANASPLAAASINGPYDVANKLVFTTATNSAHALLLTLDADASFASCTDTYAQPWDYVVSCYDGCTQPLATFTVVDDCDADQFSVTVNITQIGSSGSVSITNNGGVASSTATAVGAYTVGPFTQDAQVRFELVGASELCSYTSAVLTDGCGTIGIGENVQRSLKLYPNPTTGVVRMVLPEGTHAGMVLEVRDLAGRLVAQETMNGTNEGELTIDLSSLLNGTYVAVLQDNGQRYLTKLNIAR